MEDKKFVDQSLAKGMRRTVSRHHQRVLDGTTIPELGVRESWGKAIERLLEHYRRTLGADKILLLSKTNTRYEFLMVVDSQAEGIGVARKISVFKSNREETLEEELNGHVPISFTPHFHERYTQLPPEVAPPLAVAMNRLRLAIQDEFIAAVDGDANVYPYWRKTGEFAFVDGQLLILGGIEADKSLVCRTVIRKDRLELPKERLCKTVESMPRKFLVS